MDKNVRDGGEKSHGAEGYGRLCCGDQTGEGRGGEAEIVDDEQAHRIIEHDIEHNMNKHD